MLVITLARVLMSYRASEMTINNRCRRFVLFAGSVATDGVVAVAVTARIVTIRSPGPPRSAGAEFE